MLLSAALLQRGPSGGVSRGTSWCSVKNLPEFPYTESDRGQVVIGGHTWEWIEAETTVADTVIYFLISSFGGSLGDRAVSDAMKFALCCGSTYHCHHPRIDYFVSTSSKIRPRIQVILKAT